MASTSTRVSDAGLAKRRARRIGLDYFTLGDPTGRRRRRLAWLGLLCLIGAIVAGAILGPTKFVHSGPSHHMALVSGNVAANRQVIAETLAQEGCAACHVPFQTVTTQVCGDCHADLAQDHHPFGAWEGAKVGCAFCHKEHGGSTVPVPGDVPALCATCHESTPSVAELTKKHGAPAAALDSHVRLAYLTFPHAIHQGKDCKACHIARDAGDLTGQSAPFAADASPVYAGQHSEFKPISYASCKECHEAQAASWIADRPAPPLATWHGSDAKDDDGQSRCLECHANMHEAALPDQAAPERRFDIGRSSHAHVAQVEVTGRACAACHRRGVDSIEDAGTIAQRVFPHETHVAGLATATEKDCKACHQQTIEGHGLPLSPAKVVGAAPEVCVECHSDKTTTPARSMVSEVEPNPAVPARRFARFPHDQEGHRKLACSECHFQSSEGVVAATKPTASDCTACHAGHRNIAGDGCAKCHTPGVDVVYWGADKPEKQAKWVRPTDPSFRHASPGHANRECAECHDVGKTMAANTISAVPIPTEATTASCRECHVSKQARFHFK